MKRSFLAALVLLCTPASAQLLIRTAVSINGNDANNCAVTTPCRSFVRALTQTAYQGEVIALDSGGYGPFDITSSVTISGAPGVHAAISTSGHAILINAASFDSVTLRNLRILGHSPFNISSAIIVNTVGPLTVERCSIMNFPNGAISFDAPFGELIVTGSSFRNNESALAMSRGSARIDDSRMENNFSAVRLFGGHITLRNSFISGGTAGVSVTPSEAASFVMDNTVITNADTAVYLEPGSQPLTVSIANSHLTHSATGVYVGLNATASLSANTIMQNGVGIMVESSGVARVFGDNAVHANGTNLSGPGTITTFSKQ